jgi:hypothetical protein
MKYVVPTNPDPPQAVALLRARRERPSDGCRAAERGEEFSAFDVACHVTFRFGGHSCRDDTTLPSHGL